MNDSTIVENARKQQDQEVHRLKGIICSLEREKTELLINQRVNKETIDQITAENKKLHQELTTAKTALQSSTNQNLALKRERDTVFRLPYKEKEGPSQESQEVSKPANPRNSKGRRAQLSNRSVNEIR